MVAEAVVVVGTALIIFQALPVLENLVIANIFFPIVIRNLLLLKGWQNQMVDI